MCGTPAGVNSTESTLSNLATQQQANQNQAFQTAVPFEQQTLQEGVPGLDVATGDVNAITAAGAAPARGQLNRSLTAAGINPSDPRAIAAQAGLTQQTGQALAQNQMQALIQNFMARSGAGSGLLQFGSSQSPLAALSTLLQGQLNA